MPIDGIEWLDGEHLEEMAKVAREKLPAGQELRVIGVAVALLLEPPGGDAEATATVLLDSDFDHGELVMAMARTEAIPITEMFPDDDGDEDDGPLLTDEDVE